MNCCIFFYERSLDVYENLIPKVCLPNGKIEWSAMPPRLRVWSYAIAEMLFQF